MYNYGVKKLFLYVNGDVGGNSQLKDKLEKCLEECKEKILKEGLVEGRAEGIKVLIKSLRKMNISDEQIHILFQNN